MKEIPGNPVPRLRFSEFDAVWEFPLLDSVAVRGSGHTPSKDHPEYYDGEIDWISLADSKSLDRGYISKTKTRISEKGLANSSAVLHAPETVILSRDAGVGKSAVMKHSMAVSQHFIAWRPVSDVSCSWFLYYWLQIQKREFERIAIGSTIKTIGLPYFKKLRIPIPSLPEQRKIAGFLTAVDKRIQQLTQKKALLEDYKKGVMQQLFTQAIRFKDDHGNDFPDWEEKKLGELGTFTGGGTPDTDNDSYWNGCIPWISSSDVSESSIIEIKKHRFITKAAIEESATKLVPRNSILFISRVGVGKLAICVEEVCTSQDFTSFTPYTDHLGYLGYYFFFNQNLLKRYAQGTSIKGITSQELKKIAVSRPSPSEQSKIANFLSAIDRKIQTVATQIAETQTFKRGLLQQMFV